MKFELIPSQTTQIQVRGEAIVRCVRGQLWITQESDEHDYIVREGMYFQTRKKGSLVVAAMNDPSTVIVWCGPNSSHGESEVHIDYGQVQRLITKAQHMRAEELHRLCRKAGAWFLHLVSSRADAKRVNLTERLE